MDKSKELQRSRGTQQRLSMKNKIPCFFKIVIGDQMTQRLRIPQLYVKQFQNDMSNKESMMATIKGFNDFWQIKLTKRGTLTYLEDGWQKVVQDNFLGNGEFLLFKYEGELCFNMQIFELSGVERIRTTSASFARNDREEPNKEIIDLEGEPTAKTEVEAVGSMPQAPASISQNPSFTLQMKAYHVQTSCILRIPTKFSLEHFPGSERKTVIVRNSEGKGWEVSAVKNLGTTCLSGGWRHFVRANNIKPGDHCKFELLDKFEMMVYKA